MPHVPYLRFDFQNRDGQVESQVFTQPERVIAATAIKEVRPALRAVQEAVNAGLYAAGYIAYEAAPAFDPAFTVCGPPAIPLLWFGIFREPLPPISDAEGEFAISDWRPDVGREEYESNLIRVREALGQGESYQVNYTIRMRAHFTGDDAAYYHRLCATQGGGYHAYLNLGRFRILSASPELFFRWSGREIQTRPMKGTVRRGRWPAEDNAASRWLAASPKNRAENATIVDLLRNDLSRIAEPGCVTVSRMFAIERYRTVLQMTSTISALLRPGATLETVFEALFPCGSVTGAPKISTMRLIAALERTPRQAYCGAVGWIAPGGDAVFNVAIRSVLLDTCTGIAEYGVGGGITWDSDPADEYAEILTKSRVLTDQWPAFDLLETLRLEDGRYTLLDRHLDRLEESAAYFGIPVSRSIVRDTLDAYARSHAAGLYVVRLLVSHKGQAQVEDRPMAPAGEEPAPAAFAAAPISTDDCFLFHKTTNRKVYEEARAGHTDVLDVLLWNERGEMTEFTVGNLVAEMDGQRWTPPRECGLLAGTFRAKLLEQGEIQERVLTPADVRAASALWLVNSVRGWIRVRLVE